MNYRKIFPAHHAILPVIHVCRQQQALRNVKIARDAGADGVFLIGHNMSSTELLSIHRVVAAEHHDWWVGVNCLGLRPVEVFKRIDDTVAGVWTDNAMIYEHMDPQPDAEEVLAARDAAGWSGLYFGGVAFKYQRHVSDLVPAAQKSAKYMDVVTTSGSGTGHAANVEKIRMMKQALGDFPLAIASGITPENVVDYLNHADCFLVATGISNSFEELNPDRTAALIRNIRNGG